MQRVFTMECFMCNAGEAPHRLLVYSEFLPAGYVVFV